MIRLQDSIRIRTTPGHIFKWLESMPSEYCAWHPDHVACRVLHGSMFQAGSEIKCQEFLHGKLHTMRLRPRRIDPGRCVEYEIAGLGGGFFEVVPEGEEVDFIAGLALGSDFPVLGQLVDVVLRSFFGRRLEAMRQHMREEGWNLKQILESGWNPS